MPTLAVSYTVDRLWQPILRSRSKGPASHPVRGRNTQSLEILAQDFGD